MTIYRAILLRMGAFAFAVALVVPVAVAWAEEDNSEIRGLAHSLPAPEGLSLDAGLTVPVLANTPLPRLLPADPALRVVLQGKNIEMDEQLEDAVAPASLPNRVGLRRAWTTLALTGQMDFTAEVIDRLAQPQDIEVTVATRGCRMKPRFFAYPLDQVSATVRYARERKMMAAGGATE